MNPKIVRTSLILPLVLALSSHALAGGTTAQAADAAPCAKEKFRGKQAKARRLACLDALQKQQLASETRRRAEIEALRLELRERCAQDPRTCESRQAELEEKLHGNWRDQEGEGHAAH